MRRLPERLRVFASVFAGKIRQAIFIFSIFTCVDFLIFHIFSFFSCLDFC